MKNAALLFVFGCILSFIGCSKKHKRYSGRISVDLFVYNDPTGDVYNSFKIPISTLYFIENEIIEELPVYNDSINPAPFVYIKDNKYAYLPTLAHLRDQSLSFLPVKEKNVGVKFIGDTIENYAKRENMPDTSFAGYNYRRVRIVSPEAYTVFYIHRTDTILPFSLSPQFDKDYEGILNRIDTYEIKENRFTSLRMSLNDTIPQRIYTALKAIL